MSPWDIFSNLNMFGFRMMNTLERTSVISMFTINVDDIIIVVIIFVGISGVVIIIIFIIIIIIIIICIVIIIFIVFIYHPHTFYFTCSAVI